MFGVIFSFVIIVVVSIIIFNIIKGQNVGESIQDMIKQFNDIVKSCKNNDLEFTKTRLYEILDKYKEKKIAEFTEAAININHSLTDLQKQREITISNLSKAESLALKHKLLYKEKGLDSDKKISAEWFTTQKQLETALKNIDTAIATIEKQQSDLNVQINLFIPKYEMKRAEIYCLTTSNVLDFSSMNDLKLDSLVDEFKVKIEDAKTTKEVREKIFGVQKEKIDYSKEFEEYLNA